MINVFDQLKKPFSLLYAVIGAVSVIIGSVITIDSRYAKAEDVKTLKLQQQEMFNDLYKRQIEDRLLELNLKSKKDNNDQALIKYYERKIDSLKPENKK